MNGNTSQNSSTPSTTTVVDTSSELHTSGLLYRSHHNVKVGGVHRFIINYTPNEDNVRMENIDSLYVKIKNVEMIPLRAAFLVGPFILYCDIKPIDFDHNKKCFITADQPTYNPNLSAGQSLVAELSTHTIKPKYVWVVDVISQMIFSSTADIHFEIMIGTDKMNLHRHNFRDNFGTFTNNVNVQHQDTLDLWNRPPPLSKDKPVHLVMLTHGLHSNSTADMFYIKEQIENHTRNNGENVIVRCFPGNVCKTERGVKYLGRRLAEHIVHEICTPDVNVKKISFIAHSLGGLVQTFAISYIDHNYPHFFQEIEPINFITMASPLLGISNENPAYIKIALSAGVVGKTGQDLGLQGFKPLLMLLPSKPTRKILRKFKRRTLYANALHDGIVPLRTAALLYLDWKGLSKVHDLIGQENGDGKSTEMKEPNNSNEEDGDTIEEIPEDSERLSSSDDNSTTLKSKVLSPLNYVMSLMVPNLQSKEKGKRYQRYQTKDEETDDMESYINPLPKSSMIASATSVLLPPLPPLKFLVDPSSRPKAILHDKVYMPESIPKVSRKSSSFIENIDPVKRQRALEEEIARRWHKGLSWRKVIVNLLPDAHNNIVVRRTFANAYGWPVVQHMVENHFALNDDYDDDVVDSESDSENEDEEEESEKNGDIMSPGEDSDDQDNARDKTNSEKLADILEYQHQKAKTYHERSLTSEGSNRTGSNKITKARQQPEETGVSEETPSVIHKKKVNQGKDGSIRSKGNKYQSDSESEEEEHGSWLNDDSSEYYDGPTGTFSNMQETLNETLYSWKQSFYNQLEQDNNGGTLSNQGMGGFNSLAGIRDVFTNAISGGLVVDVEDDYNPQDIDVTPPPAASATGASTAAASNDIHHHSPISMTHNESRTSLLSQQQADHLFYNHIH